MSLEQTLNTLASPLLDIFNIVKYDIIYLKFGI